jgi:hypothetical protein
MTARAIGAVAARTSREDLGDHGRMFDGGDDLQGAAALGAVFPIELTSLTH